MQIRTLVTSYYGQSMETNKKMGNISRDIALKVLQLSEAIEL